MPAPASFAALVGKAAVIVASTLALAVHALWARPFAPEHAWKGPVRAALLVLAAASAAIVAWAGAIDLRVLGGPGASRGLAAGSYVLVALFAVVIAVLVTGVAVAMLRGARNEQVLITAAAEAVAAARGRQEGLRLPRVDAAPGPAAAVSEPANARSPRSVQVLLSDGAPLAVPPAVAAAAPDSKIDVAFAVNPLAVRRRKGVVRSSRQRQRPLSGGAGVAETLAVAIASIAGHVAAEEGDAASRG